jgi:adenylate cyclase
MLRGVEGTTRNKLIAGIVIALGTTLLGWLLQALPATNNALARLDDVFYDWFYHLRPIESRQDQPIVIVTIDENSLKYIDRELKWGWPWPREFYGRMAKWLDGAGAKAIVIDMRFAESSVFNNLTDDDNTFVQLMSEVKTPVIFANHFDGRSPEHFAPPIKNPTFGATNVVDRRVIRRYPQTINGAMSLARRGVELSGLTSHPLGDPFHLRYHGPHVDTKGNFTYRYIPAGKVIAVAMDPKNTSVSADEFKGKIVLIGATASGLFDVKESPLSSQYPGVEVHATAIDNFLNGEEVHVVRSFPTAACALAISLLAAIGIVVPRNASVKIVVTFVCILVAIVFPMSLFQGKTIHFLAPAMLLVTLAIATIAGFVFSYQIEDRQRRFMLKALSRYVSPRVADELAKDPSRLSLGGESRTMTVMFTDAAGFTQLSETLSPDQVSKLMNFYLDELSDVVLKEDATLDKFIGDAIMCFWNAPLEQPNHALTACRVARAMQRRCDELQEDFKRLGAVKGLYMRVGVSTGPMVVGNMGSSQRFSYTVLGDAVNYASRLEGANKFFGTRILLAESTAEIVKGKLPTRRLDYIRVKGRNQAEFIYELLVTDDRERLQFAQDYEAAWAHYRARKWNQAEQSLLAILSNFGDDLMSRSLLQRVREYRTQEPAADWDGSYNLSEK